VADDTTTSVEIDWNDEEIKAVLAGASFEGLQLAAEHLLQVSSTLVPHEEGELERSGDTDEDEEAGAVSVFYDRPYHPLLSSTKTSRLNTTKEELRNSWRSVCTQKKTPCLS
jgi:hypothetical protein